jgi:hypothetical protein
VLYQGGNLCPSNLNESYSLTIEIKCNMQATTPIYVIETASLSNPCSPKVIMSSMHGCPVITSDALWRFHDSYEVYIAVFMIITGLFLMVCGGRFARLAFEITTTCIVGTILIVYLFLY